MAFVNNHVIVSTCNKRLGALEKHASKSKMDLFFDGKRLKPNEVRAIYQQCLDTRAALETKRAELKATLTEAEAAEKRRVAFDNVLRAWVITQFGPTSQVAYEFGFPPRKAAVKSVETKHQAVEQSKATRLARHTMGKKQKESVVGVIPLESAPSPEPPTGNGKPNGAATVAPSNGAAHA